MRYPYVHQKLTRQEEQDLGLPMWKRYRQISGDLLAFRWLTLRVHGRGTLINCIMNHHGRPNAY